MATLTAPTEVADAVGERLKAATVAHRDAQERARSAAKLWKETIVEARDAGMPEKTVADLAGVARGRIHAIMYEAYATA